MTADRRTALFPAWAVVLAVALAFGTVWHLGFSADAVAWGVVQVILVGIASYDIRTGLVKNVVTLPVSILALALRLAFERHALVEVAFAGLVVLLGGTAVAVLSRGGIGFGDAKLAGMLGFLLGWDIVGALAIGALSGGVAAIVVLARTRSRRAALAYGPYLALGGAVAVLFLNPPPLL